MNASLVLLHLLLFLSTCHGKERDGSPPSSILPTTKWQKKVEAPLEISCPDPTDIEPCKCNNYGYLVMSCSNVQDEEQLRNVFSAFFPTTEFYRFTMVDNYGLKVLEDGVFGNVSFQQLFIYECVLETVKNDALTPSLSTLIQIWIENCGVEIFPFESLAAFTSLQVLSLPNNTIHTLPPLSSSSLETINVGSNLITHITQDVFKLLPAVKRIYLDGNHLTEIPKGAFTDLPNLYILNLYRNNISYVQSLTIELISPSFANPELYLTDNNIDSVEVDAFKGVAGPGNIGMGNNALTRLPEEVWRPVLEKNITVDLLGNDLACGCDVAWLVRDPQLMPLVRFANCTDGTLLTDLNPDDFDVCG